MDRERLRTNNLSLRKFLENKNNCLGIIELKETLPELDLQLVLRETGAGDQPLCGGLFSVPHDVSSHSVLRGDKAPYRT
jgi:hypothetical protein